MSARDYALRATLAAVALLIASLYLSIRPASLEVATAAYLIAYALPFVGPLVTALSRRTRLELGERYAPMSLTLGSIASVATLRVDRVILGLAGLSADLALYATASIVTELAALPARIFAEALTSRWGNSPRDPRVVAFLTAAATGVLMTLVAIVYDDAVGLLFGERYVASRQYLPLLGIATAGLAWFRVVAGALMADPSRRSTLAVLEVSLLLIVIVSTPVVVGWRGAYGAAALSMVVYWGAAIVASALLGGRHPKDGASMTASRTKEPA